jgi:hypothetical protein
MRHARGPRDGDAHGRGAGISGLRLCLGGQQRFGARLGSEHTSSGIVPGRDGNQAPDGAGRFP